MNNVKVQPANGKLGVMCVGLGAVTTTMIVGSLMARKGLSKPIGSFACDGMMRLGKGRDKVYKEVKDIVPVAELCTSPRGILSQNDWPETTRKFTPLKPESLSAWQSSSLGFTYPVALCLGTPSQ